MNKKTLISPCAALIAFMAPPLSMEAQQAQTACYEVIPAPCNIEHMQDKPFALNGKVTIMHPEGNEAMRRNASFMAGYIERLTGLRLNTMAYGNDKYNDNGDGKDKGKSMDNGNICLRLGLEADNPEAYRITVTQRGVTIEGKTEAGVFYGMQTLRKAMRPGRGGTTLLPAAVINDEPRFGYRGAHYDVSRHFFSVEDTKRYIDMMALHNMNRLHWHITDDQGWRLEIKSHPELTAIGSWRKGDGDWP